MFGQERLDTKHKIISSVSLRKPKRWVNAKNYLAVCLTHRVLKILWSLGKITEWKSFPLECTFEAICNMGLTAVNYFRKQLHPRCLTRFWMRLWGADVCRCAWYKLHICVFLTLYFFPYHSNDPQVSKIITDYFTTFNRLFSSIHI